MTLFCADSWFLISVFDNRDQDHAASRDLFEHQFSIRKNRLLAPWPILYEAISTRLVKNRHRMARMERDWSLLRRNSQLLLIDDSPFRDAALNDCLNEPIRAPSSYRDLSLADRVIRAFLLSRSLRVGAVLSKDAGALQDVCHRLGIEILPHP